MISILIFSKQIGIKNSFTNHKKNQFCFLTHKKRELGFILKCYKNDNIYVDFLGFLKNV